MTDEPVADAIALMPSGDLGSRRSQAARHARQASGSDRRDPEQMKSLWERLRKLMRLQIGTAPGANPAKEIAQKAIKLELVMSGAMTRMGP